MKNDSREKREREEGIRKENSKKNISSRSFAWIFVDIYDPNPNLKEGRSYSQKLIRDNKKTFRGCGPGVP